MSAVTVTVTAQTRAELIAALAPGRRPDTWCLCRHVGCLAWDSYVADCVRVYGHEPTEQEMESDAQILATLRQAGQRGAS